MVLQNEFTGKIKNTSDKKWWLNKNASHQRESKLYMLNGKCTMVWDFKAFRLEGRSWMHEHMDIHTYTHTHKHTHTSTHTHTHTHTHTRRHTHAPQTHRHPHTHTRTNECTHTHTHTHTHTVSHTTYTHTQHWLELAEDVSVFRGDAGGLQHSDTELELGAEGQVLWEVLGFHLWAVVDLCSLATAFWEIGKGSTVILLSKGVFSLGTFFFPFQNHPSKLTLSISALSISIFKHSHIKRLVWQYLLLLVLAPSVWVLRLSKCACTCIYVCVCVCVCARMHACMCACMHVCVWVEWAWSVHYVGIFNYQFIPYYIGAHTHTHTHTHTHIHTHNLHQQIETHTHVHSAQNTCTQTPRITLTYDDSAIHPLTLTLDNAQLFAGGHNVLGWCALQNRAAHIKALIYFMFSAWKKGAFGAPLTPSLPQPVKFLGWKMHGLTCKRHIFRSYDTSTFNGIFSGPMTHLLSMAYFPVLWHIYFQRHIFRSYDTSTFNGIFSGPMTHLLSTVCTFMKILLHASAKKKTRRLKGFKFHTFMGCFQVTL